ncbi:MAG: tRNA methyltransferase, has a role in tRNA modification [Bogoriella megaspora]|nr:MAG: tRNA methyltransferase, has a role in tRNA modification [Bogoriella megaspora]
MSGIDEQAYEEEHVHSVYEQIASHFSSTRYKPWPIVENFLRSQPEGSIGLDLGCGNGKYLGVNKSVFIVGSDRERRVLAIKAVLDVLRPGQGVSGSPADHAHAEKSSRGKALIYVWALEQKHSRRGWDEGDEQDVMVPWVMKSGKKTEPRDAPLPSTIEETTYHRYYHLYRKGELEDDIKQAGGIILDSGYEKDNWWAITGPSTSPTS